MNLALAYDLTADWHDKQARMFKEMSQDYRTGEAGMKKAADAARHHAGSSAALRLASINLRRKELHDV